MKSTERCTRGCKWPRKAFYPIFVDKRREELYVEHELWRMRVPIRRDGGVLSVKEELRGCGEGWASHFSVHARKESALIIEFVSESHVAELIQHQKVIDYTATYNG